MPQWRIRAVLVGLVKADASDVADKATLEQVVAELPDAELIRHERNTCEFRFPLDAVDDAAARRVGFEMVRSAVLRHLAMPAMTSVTVTPMSGEVDPRAALNAHLASAFNHLARVIGLFAEVLDDLMAADVYFEQTGLDKRNHQVVTSEIEDLENWSVEKMKQVLTRMAALEVRSRE